MIGATWFVGPSVTPLGLVATAAGVALIVWAARAMGWAVSPFPTPSRNARLVRDGPFGFLRHPIYVGGVLVFAGLSLVFSGWALVPTAVLAVFWIAKARLEERRLLERFPEYAAYRRQTLF